MNDTPQFPEIAQQPAPRKSRKKLIVTIIVLSALLLGSWAAVAWLVTSGKVTVWETKAPVANRDGSLCQNVIAQYNSVFDTTNNEEYTQKLNGSANAAKSADPNETDPTCVYIRFNKASMTQDNAEAKRLANVLKALASQGAYMSTELANPQNIDTIMYSVENQSDEVPVTTKPVPTKEEVGEGEG
jgi:flagellar basal body-associated protein FliL